MIADALIPVLILLLLCAAAWKRLPLYDLFVQGAQEGLRTAVAGSMSPKRFRHTVAVEVMTERLCALFCKDLTMPMRAAALLHDCTKELSVEEQIALCRELGLSVTDADQLAPKTLHARSAAACIPVHYPAFDDPLIVDAVRWHTTGHAGMTLTEKILYLADYIDDSRNFESCVILRRYFWGAHPEKMTEKERLDLLRDTLILSFDMTMRDLLSEGRPISVETAEARNELLLERSKA
jgi:nicotinate-nucleotide adenylyltransferase